MRTQRSEVVKILTSVVVLPFIERECIYIYIYIYILHLYILYICVNILHLLLFRNIRIFYPDFSLHVVLILELFYVKKYNFILHHGSQVPTVF